MEQRELKRRLGAALRYAGLTQEELGDRFAGDGLGVEDPGRIQRGQKQMQHVHADAFARHTGLPIEWFTADEVAGVFSGPVELPAVVGPLQERMDRALANQADALVRQREQAEKVDDLCRLVQKVLDSEALLLAGQDSVRNELRSLREGLRKPGQSDSDANNG